MLKGQDRTDLNGCQIMEQIRRYVAFLRFSRTTVLQHLVHPSVLSRVDVLNTRGNSCPTCALMLKARSTSYSPVQASLLHIGAAERRGVRGRICDHAGTSERPLQATVCAWNTVFRSGTLCSSVEQAARALEHLESVLRDFRARNKHLRKGGPTYGFR